MVSVGLATHICFCVLTFVYKSALFQLLGNLVVGYHPVSSNPIYC